MNRRFLTCVALIAVAVIGGGIALRAQPEKPEGTNEDLAKAPKAVQESVKKLVGANKMSGFGTEKTFGLTIFVVEVEAKNGREYAMGLDAGGKVIVRWVGLDASIMPAEVMEAATKAHPNGKIGETTICMVRNKLSYCLENKVGNDTYQMMCDADGKVTYDEIKRGSAEK
jgi:hypothetical protein